MTTFAAPVNTKRNEMGESGANAVLGAVQSRYSIPLGIQQTGVAVGTTTVPLFVAPAGTRFYECVIDVLTDYNNTAGVNVAIGVPTSTGILFAATTVNTTGRRPYVGAAAQLAFNAIPLAADTTVQAIVSITTSAVTTGSLVVHVVVG